MENNFIIVLGRKGQGKSYWVKWFVQHKKRLIIFDPQNQFTGCGVVIRNPLDFYHFIQKNKYGSFRVVYQPNVVMSDRNVKKEHFKKICSAIVILEDIYFVVDEINLCTNKSSKENEWFINIIDAGRHKRQSLIATTLRYTSVDTDIRGQADAYILFQTINSDDVSYFVKNLGEQAKVLPSLPPYHYLQFHKGHLSLEKPIKND